MRRALRRVALPEQTVQYGMLVDIGQHSKPLPRGLLLRCALGKVDRLTRVHGVHNLSFGVTCVLRDCARVTFGNHRLLENRFTMLACNQPRQKWVTKEDKTSL